MKYRKQKVAINNKTTLSEAVIAGVSQGSINGQLLFNLFINDLILFLYTTVLSSYADGNNFYAIGNDKDETKRALVKDFQTVLTWFYENYTVFIKPINYCLKVSDKCSFNFFFIITEKYSICVWVKTWRKTKLCKFRAN